MTDYEMVPAAADDCTIHVYGFVHDDLGAVVAVTAMPPGTDTSGPVGSFMLSPDAAMQVASRLMAEAFKMSS